MSEPTREPNPLAALVDQAYDKPWTFTVDGRTGTLRMQDFGDLWDWSDKTHDIEKMMVLLKKCADPVARELLRAMSMDDGFATYIAWEKWVRNRPGK